MSFDDGRIHVNIKQSEFSSIVLGMISKTIAHDIKDGVMNFSKFCFCTKLKGELHIQSIPKSLQLFLNVYQYRYVCNLNNGVLNFR